jgi:hypothetical protein
MSRTLNIDDRHENLWIRHPIAVFDTFEAACERLE